MQIQEQFNRLILKQNAAAITYYILEQSKKTRLQFSNGTTKVM